MAVTRMLRSTCPRPGLGPVLGARVLGEFGDDPDRYASGKARKNYACTSPITRASGKRKVVAARFIRNNRLTDALMAQALSALSASPGARALYDAERPAAPGTTPPCANSPTGWSASSTDASKPAPSTTRQPPGRTRKRLLNLTSPLDTCAPGMFQKSYTLGGTRFSGVLSFLNPYCQGGRSAQLTRIDAGHWAYMPIPAIVPPCAGNAVLFVLPAC